MAAAAPLCRAASYGAAGECRRLLGQLGEPAQCDANERDPTNSITCLQYAAMGGWHGVVHVLVDAGARPSDGGPNLWSPLHYAAATGSEECVLVLLDAGADPRQRSAVGESPADVAASNDHDELAELLGAAAAAAGERPPPSRQAQRRSLVAARWTPGPVTPDADPRFDLQGTSADALSSDARSARSEPSRAPTRGSSRAGRRQELAVLSVAFDKIDADGSRTLDVGEVAAELGRLGMAEAAEEVFAQLDASGIKEVTMDDWLDRLPQAVGERFAARAKMLRRERGDDGSGVADDVTLARCYAIAARAAADNAGEY